jgi:hypothetical protein
MKCVPKFHNLVLMLMMLIIERENDTATKKTAYLYHLKSSRISRYQNDAAWRRMEPSSVGPKVARSGVKQVRVPKPHLEDIDHIGQFLKLPSYFQAGIRVEIASHWSSSSILNAESEGHVNASLPQTTSRLRLQSYQTSLRIRVHLSRVCCAIASERIYYSHMNAMLICGQSKWR